jgi:hypothetical protein
MKKKPCTYCEQEFHPSRYHPDQRVCSSTECQRRRRADYHREKLATDPEYLEQCRDSQKKWREKNPGYMKQYRAKHQVGCHHDFERARLLNDLHQLADSVKNNLVFDLRAMDASIWLISDGVIQEKNNLASAKVIILQGPLRVVKEQRMRRTSL